MWSYTLFVNMLLRVPSSIFRFMFRSVSSVDRDYMFYFDIIPVAVPASLSGVFESSHDSCVTILLDGCTESPFVAACG